jgi:hypothetical protein
LIRCRGASTRSASVAAEAGLGERRGRSRLAEMLQQGDPHRVQQRLGALGIIDDVDRAAHDRDAS